MEKDTKSTKSGFKINFSNFDLSAFFILNLKSALKIDDLQFKRIAHKEANNKSSK